MFLLLLLHCKVVSLHTNILLVLETGWHKIEVSRLYYTSIMLACSSKHQPQCWNIARIKCLQN